MQPAPSSSRIDCIPVERLLAQNRLAPGFISGEQDEFQGGQTVEQQPQLLHNRHISRMLSWRTLALFCDKNLQKPLQFFDGSLRQYKAGEGKKGASKVIRVCLGAALTPVSWGFLPRFL